MTELLTIPGVFLLAYAALGLLAGILAGLLGVGGGLVIVPALILLFHYQGFDESYRVHMAIGTSLTTIVVTSLSSMAAHQRRGAISWPVVRQLTPGLLLGTLFGAWLADQMNTWWLQRSFGLFVIIVSFQMYKGRIAEHPRPLPGAPVMSLTGGLIGAVSGVVGIGGGSMTVPFLVWFGRSMRNAVATSAACGFPIAVAGSLGFMMFGDPVLQTGNLGYVYWPAAIIIGLLSVLMAPFGAQLAHSLPLEVLKRVFAALLFVVGLRLIF